MDNSAYLRIKFTPLLKKISSKNIDSKCCIEIVPELANTLNLNKINWRDQNDLVEYNIPMTYRVTIKKPNRLTNELENKIYHSCVDLLPAYSMSNTNLAAGDIKKIKSDTIFLLNSCACDEKCDVMPTKALLANNAISNQYEHRSTGMQAANTVNHSSGMDECMEPYSCSNIPFIKTNLRASKSEETLKAEVNKNDNATTTDLINQSLTDLSKKNSTGSLNAHIESFTEKYGRCKLSLSPICSVSTWDKYSTKPIYLTNTAAHFEFCKGDTLNRANLYDIGDNPPIKKNSNKDENKTFSNDTESNQIVRFHTTKTNVTIQIIDNSEGVQNSNDAKNGKSVPSKPRYTTVRDITTSVSHITMTSNGINNNFYQKHTRISQNIFEVKNVKKSLNLSNKITPTSNFEQQDVIFAEDKIINANKNNTAIICRIDPNKNRFQVRAPPAIRVARIMKLFEEEIFPLTEMLNEIKYKCVGLGLSDLFRGEFVPPFQKSIMYSPISNFNYNTDESNSQKTNGVKSNRVVYTFLFNG